MALHTAKYRLDIVCNESTKQGQLHKRNGARMIQRDPKNDSEFLYIVGSFLGLMGKFYVKATKKTRR